MTGTYDDVDFGGENADLTVAEGLVTFDLDDAALGAASGTWTLDLLVAGQSLADGIYEVTVTTRDALGNTAQNATAGELSMSCLATASRAVRSTPGSEACVGGRLGLIAQRTLQVPSFFTPGLPPKTQ